MPRSAQLVARNNGINCRAPVVVQETAARTAAATGRMDDGAAGRGAVDRQRTPEQVCLSWDSVCTGAPGLSPL